MKYEINANNSDGRVVMTLDRIAGQYAWIDPDGYPTEERFPSRKAALAGARAMWPARSVWAGKLISL